MNIIYQSPNYKEEDCVRKYLRINSNNKIQIAEVNEKSLTIKEYETDREEYIKQLKEYIDEAEKVRHIYPSYVNIPL